MYGLWTRPLPPAWYVKSTCRWAPDENAWPAVVVGASDAGTESGVAVLTLAVVVEPFVVEAASVIELAALGTDVDAVAAGVELVHDASAGAAAAASPTSAERRRNVRRDTLGNLGSGWGVKMFMDSFHRSVTDHPVSMLKAG